MKSSVGSSGGINWPEFSGLSTTSMKAEVNAINDFVLKGAPYANGCRAGGVQSCGGETPGFVACSRPDLTDEGRSQSIPLKRFRR